MLVKRVATGVEISVAFSAASQFLCREGGPSLHSISGSPPMSPTGDQKTRWPTNAAQPSRYKHYLEGRWVNPSSKLKMLTRPYNFADLKIKKSLCLMLKCIDIFILSCWFLNHYVLLWELVLLSPLLLSFPSSFFRATHGSFQKASGTVSFLCMKSLSNSLSFQNKIVTPRPEPLAFHNLVSVVLRRLSAIMPATPKCLFVSSTREILSHLQVPVVRHLLTAASRAGSSSAHHSGVPSSGSLPLTTLLWLS